MPELNPPDPGLERWLQIATRDLCDKAKGRLYAEYQSHYADATQAAMDAGASRADAEAAALADLGDPRVARRALNRTHLTRREMEAVQDLRQAPPAKGVWGVLKALAGFSANVILLAFVFPLKLVLAYIAYSALRGLMWRLLLRHSWQAPLRLALVGALLAPAIDYGIVIALAWVIVNPFVALILLSIICIMAGPYAWLLTNLICKLSRLPAIADDYEPPRTLGA